MDYAYIAYDGQNKIVNGSVTAISETVANDRLTKLGLKVLSVKKTSSLNVDISRLFKSGKDKVKTEQIVLFGHQVATLLNAGVNLVTSLEMLQTQTVNRELKEVLGKVIVDIRTGHKFSESISRFPSVFPSLFCRSLSVGEQSGELAKVLNQASDYIEKNVNARKGLKSALAYPAFMLVIATVVVFVLINFVFPTFIGLYSTMGAKIPPVTKLMLSIVDFIKIIFPYFIGLIVVAALAIFIYIRTPNGKYNWDKFLLKLPILGNIILLRELTGNCRTMSMLFRAGLPLSEILDVIVDSTSNQAVINSWKEVKTAVYKGEGLSGPMAKNPIFLPMMVEMVKVGEETGEMDATLLAVAQNYDSEADSRTKAFIAVIQPAMTIIIGAIVFLIVLSMMSLMYSIYGQIKT